MAMTKKPHQKRLRQHDDSDEDFTKDVNAVGRVSDEDTGGPSEPTKSA